MRRGNTLLDMSELKKLFTQIVETAREKLEITRDDYALCSYIHYRGADSRQKIAGWCCDPKDEIARFVGVTRRGLYKIIDRMQEKNLLEVGALGALRVTPKWIDTENKCEQSSQKEMGQSVNKVHSACEQSSQHGVNKVPQTNKVLSKSISKSKKEGCADAPLAEPFTKIADIEIPESPIPLEAEEKKKTPPRSAHPPLKKEKGEAAEPWTKTIATLFDKVGEEKGAEPFNWEVNAGRDFKALKEIKKAMSGDIKKKRGHEPQPQEIESGFEYLFRYGFEYLEKIAQTKGGAIQYSPQTIKNCYNQIVSYAKGNHNGAKRATNKATEQHRELIAHLMDRRAARFERENAFSMERVETAGTF